MHLENQILVFYRIDDNQIPQDSVFTVEIKFTSHPSLL